jgi:hypothetical protein
MVTTWDGSGAKRDQQPSQRASCASTDPGQFVPRMMPRSWEAGVQPPGAALCSCSLGSWTPSAAPSLAGLAVAAHRPSPRTPGPHHGFASRISAQTGTALRPSPSSTRGPPASRPALNGNAVSSELAQHLCGLSGAPALPLDQTQPTATVWPIGRQGAACSSRSFKAKSLTRTLSAPSWTAGRLNSNQVPTNGWALPPASPTTAASSPWSGLCPRSCPPQQRPARAGCLVEPGIQAPGRGRLPRLHAGAHLSGGRVGPGWLCPGDPGPQRGHGAPGWPWPGPGADHGRAGPAHPWHDRG